jgi:hypothetical protein
MLRLLVLLAALPLAAGCSLFEPEIDLSAARAVGEEGVLVNRSPNVLVTVAVSETTALLIDLAPVISLDDTTLPTLAPDRAAPLDVMGFDPTEGVVVFVYVVSGREARYRRSVALSRQAFLDAEGVVTVRRL